MLTKIPLTIVTRDKSIKSKHAARFNAANAIIIAIVDFSLLIESPTFVVLKYAAQWRSRKAVGRGNPTLQGAPQKYCALRLKNLFLAIDIA